MLVKVRRYFARYFGFWVALLGTLSGKVAATTADPLVSLLSGGPTCVGPGEPARSWDASRQVVPGAR